MTSRLEMINSPIGEKYQAKMWHNYSWPPLQQRHHTTTGMATVFKLKYTHQYTSVYELRMHHIHVQVYITQCTVGGYTLGEYIYMYHMYTHNNS